MSDTMTQILVGLLCGYAGYGLRVGREASDRRRKFRADIRNSIDSLLAHENVGLLAAYKASVPIIKLKCNEVWSDVFLWKRRRMERAKDEYCGLKDGQVDPLKANAAEFIGTMTNEERTQAWQQSRKRLKNALENLERSAAFW